MLVTALNRSFTRNAPVSFGTATGNLGTETNTPGVVKRKLSVSSVQLSGVPQSPCTPCVGASHART
jgi:hypothetical protein